MWTFPLCVSGSVVCGYGGVSTVCAASACAGCSWVSFLPWEDFCSSWEPGNHSHLKLNFINTKLYCLQRETDAFSFLIITSWRFTCANCLRCQVWNKIWLFAYNVLSSLNISKILWLTYCILIWIFYRLNKEDLKSKFECCNI